MRGQDRPALSLVSHDSSRLYVRNYEPHHTFVPVTLSHPAWQGEKYVKLSCPHTGFMLANEQLQFTLHGATGLGESKVLQQKKKTKVKKAQMGEQNRIKKKKTPTVSVNSSPST